MNGYKDVSSVVVVLGGNPTGSVVYNGKEYEIPKTRLDTFVSLYQKLLNEGKRPLGIISDFRQAGIMGYYAKSELIKRSIPEDKIDFYLEKKSSATVDHPIYVKDFLRKEGLQDLPCYVITSQDSMGRVFEEFDTCFGDEIKAIYQPAQYGIEGLERIKIELYEVFAKISDAPLLLNVKRGDHRKLAQRNEVFRHIREKLVPIRLLIAGA